MKLVLSSIKLTLTIWFNFIPIIGIIIFQLVLTIL